jgi:fusion and transport protein UGO1
VLSRSVAAAATSKALSDSKLEAKARQKLRADRRLALEKGRVRDVLGLERTEESTEAIMEKERKLKKTAQRGVVKLFNAVREAQKRGEVARRDALAKGVVGMGNREEKVSEMSKQGFLDLISSGGKKSAGAVKA